jgi:hypothetical protein
VKADGTYSYHSALNYLSVHYNRSLQIDHIWKESGDQKVCTWDTENNGDNGDNYIIRSYL